MSKFSGIDATGFSIVFLVLVCALLVTEIATPAPIHGISVDLPKVGHPITMWRSSRDNALVISILRDGKMYFGRDQVTAGELPALMRARLALGAERKAYIKADARVRYGAIKQVVDAAHSAGIMSIGLLADQRRTPAR